MIKGQTIYLRSFESEDAMACLTLQTDNRDFFERFSMNRNPDFYTFEGQLENIKRQQESRNKDQEYSFGIFIKADDTLIGTISLFQVFRGSLQSAFIGYFLDRDHNGNGYTTEAVKLIVAYGFQALKLHRIEAGVMPHNVASIRVLEKSNFHKEGIARKNVSINGKWEDHQVLAIINPDD